ncbi:MAG TPA: RNA polymerase sigma-I factor [Bacillota bacterium]|nr:RNA polymerase sigma-I factor [Bacillota bacterium]
MKPDHAEARLTGYLSDIRQGNSRAREQLIEEYKPFVAKIAGNICKRYLDWSVDDELSIALIAFNQAIDLYKPEREVPFLPFARLVIESRLKDYFKQESRHQHASLEINPTGNAEETFSPAEIDQAWLEYQNRSIEDERNQEIDHLDTLLREYGIQFEDLVEHSPKHKETRTSLQKVAHVLASQPNLMKSLKSKKLLPAKELAINSQVSSKTIERGRKYIIAMALILSDAQEFTCLRSYILS